MIAGRRAMTCCTGLVLALTSPARATPLSFDCDAAPDRFSSISQALDGSAAVTGTLTTKEMRTGGYLPVAGVRFFSADDKNGTGFQIVGDVDRPGLFDVILNIWRDGVLTSDPVGQVALTAPSPFEFGLSATGLASLRIGGTHFETKFMPMREGKVMVFCSTAQFKFTDLDFTVGNTERRSEP